MGWTLRWCIFALGMMMLVLAAEAGAFTLRVTGPGGEEIGAYKWVVEEDATHAVVPGETGPSTPALNFHRSYMPVAAKGSGTGALSIPLDPAKRYYVSVLPDAGYAVGGARVEAGAEDVSVTVNRHPIPTAQITVFAFHDNHPVNNAPDTPEETGLEGFSVLVFDAAGRYGQAGGQVLKDAFGNPLGSVYDAGGGLVSKGNGMIKTDAEGMAHIKYLVPGKYGVQVVPPVGQGWVQTTTIEGTKTIDAWVKANEPQYFAEFGPPGPHVFVGFVKATFDPAALNGTNTITGQVVNMHLSRPPDYAFYNGGPFGHTTPWVGLNSLAAGAGSMVYAQRANPDGTFSIPNVPPGSYQLVVWDDNLDVIIAFKGITVQPGSGAISLGDVPVFNWFSRLESVVFFDRDQDGFRDCVTEACDDPAQDDIGIPEVPVNLRFRDGTIYQSYATDGEGFVPFDEVFPFFSWLVAEVDFTRLKATGATMIVDAGGPVGPDAGWEYPSRGVLNPQPQADVNPNTGNKLSRTETGQVLTQAFQGFLGQTSVIEWGKGNYGPGENGGISGIVQYATTRAENDPMYAAADLWEPGIPRVRVNLYRDSDRDGEIDDLDNDGGPTAADVDNYPFGNFPSGEDMDRDHDGIFDYGDALQIASTDSWDDSLPENCPGDPSDQFYGNGRCYDGLRVFNQIRPGVFDGGYAFNSYFPGGMANNIGADGNIIAENEAEGLATGTYIIEAVPPRSVFGAPVYETVKEEDRNVDFGDEYAPSPLLLPAPCVGQKREVPEYLSLFPGQEIPAPFAGSERPLCDRKQVSITDGVNGAANFFMFTEAPISGHIMGFILDDTASEFDPNSPQFGEKYAPPWIPVSIRDWTGREISRTYSDEWGVYNALVPSTFTMNVEMPSGASANMVTVCLNDPGPIPGPDGPVSDPYFNPQYSQFCYTFQYMPGTTTYLDTPVVPVGAFAGPDQFPLDCEYPAGTPRVRTVTNLFGGGPYVAAAPQRISIISEGDLEVLNPLYDGPGGTHPRTIVRDYGFGTVPGTVYVGTRQLTVLSWTPRVISAIVPVGAATGQLTVVRGDNNASSVTGITVTLGPVSGAVHQVAQGGKIQPVIDLADPGDLVIVPPGNYEEALIMWKPIQLQGWGAGATSIKAVKSPAESLEAWRQKIAALVNDGSVTLLPSQEIGFGGLEPDTLFTEEGAGILVLAKDAPQPEGFGPSPAARIDGFTITGSDNGGGIVVNGYAHYLQVSNNRIMNNLGVWGGGVRLGHASLVQETADGLVHQSGYNDNVRISNNHISQNSSLNGAGGGISLYTGSDSYVVARNHICGNFAMGGGAGIGHLGLSPGGAVTRNAIIFNESFNQGQTVSGGGVLISGAAPVGGEPLTPGSGTVRIISNLIQGNLAGAGDGGGIRTSMVNGADVAADNSTPEAWHSVDILNNLIVNNVAALAGGGISMQDSARVNVLHNTIANNDSVATAGEAFSPGSPDQSTPQPAGLVSRAHSTALASAFGTASNLARYREFSNPVLYNNIIWQNRSFYFVTDPEQDPPFYGLVPDVGAGEAAVYWDLWVIGTRSARFMSPQYSVLTNAAGYSMTNISGDPLFVDGYTNGAEGQATIPEVTTSIETMPAFDEGGNYIDVRFGPLSLTGDYRLRQGSPAIDRANAVIDALFPPLAADYEGQGRPYGLAPDMGADEYRD